jgi:hypothetical protein
MQLFLKLSLELSMDDHTKDSKKSPTYQFQLFVIGINMGFKLLHTTSDNQFTKKLFIYLNELFKR